MAHQVKIPAAGESISSATVGRWHKSDGDQVEKGDVLATIETDKVSTELEAEVRGTLKIAVEEGEEVAIGAVIAEIEDGKDGAGKQRAPAKRRAAGDPKPAAKRGTAKAVSAQATAGPKRKQDSEGEVLEIRVPAAGESIASATIAQWHQRDGVRVEIGDTLVTLETDKVSAELEAEEAGVLRILVPEGKEVAIGTVIGSISVGAEESGERAGEREPSGGSEEEPDSGARTGEDGPAPSAEARPAAPSAAPRADVPDLSVVREPAQRAMRENAEPVAEGRTTRRRMSTLRRKIAAQLVNAQHNAAILTTFNEADLSRVMELRKAVQDDFVKKHGVKLGFMSFFVKAVVQALREVPSVNARVDGDEIVQNHFYDIGIAVGTEKGLFVPVVRDADRKSFAAIEQDILAYATKARDGKIELSDLQGGCFTITNGGIYGSLLSTPILNPPQSGILGMHAIQQRPVAVDGKVEIRPMMYLALSYDHRIVDGKDAVTFLVHVKDCIESPARLMLEV